MRFSSNDILITKIDYLMTRSHPYGTLTNLERSVENLKWFILKVKIFSVFNEFSVGWVLGIHIILIYSFESTHTVKHAFRIFSEYHISTYRDNFVVSNFQYKSHTEPER